MTTALMRALMRIGLLASAALLVGCGGGSSDAAPSASSACTSSHTPDPPAVRSYYDLNWIKGLNLIHDTAIVNDPDKCAVHLNGNQIFYTETFRSTLGDVTVIGYAFVAFTNQFSGPNFTQHTLPWRQWGILCVPAGADRAGNRKGVMIAGHDAPQVFAAPFNSQWCEHIPKAFKVPVFFHGWHPDVVRSLFNKSYHETQADWMRLFLQLGITGAADLPPFQNVLVKGNMVAITFFQRTFELQTGFPIERVASFGNSKEGFAQIHLARVDDRPEVIVSTGEFSHDGESFAASLIADWNCSTAHITNPRNVDVLRESLRYYDWLTSTPAGHQMAVDMNPKNWTGQIRARHVFFGGDIGKLNSHDSAFPLLSENKFMDEFAHPSWRYLRFFDDHPGIPGDDPYGPTYVSLLPYAADVLLGGDVGVAKPEVELIGTGMQTTCTDVGGCPLTVRVTSQFAPNRVTETHLMYLFSDDRNTRLPNIITGWQFASQTFISGPAQTQHTLDFPIVVPQRRMVSLGLVTRQAEQRAPISYWKSAGTKMYEAYSLPAYQCQLPSWR